METALSLFVGLGLSAACGFRVFVPLLVMSVAAQSGHLALSESFEWIGTGYATTAFLAATILEAAGFLFPVVDHFLDAAAAPLAVAAGTVATASAVTDMSPFLQWSFAIIAGGGAAGLLHGAAAVTRAASTITTAGWGNPVLSSAETGGSVALSVLSIVFPLMAFSLVVTFLVYAGRILYVRRSGRGA